MPYLNPAETKPHLLEREQHVKAEKFLHALEMFRELNPAITGNHIASLLLVALKPGGGPTDYAKDLETTSGIVSRWMLELGERSRDGGEGFGLVDRRGGSVDLREVHYTLSPKGRTFLKKFTDRLGVGAHG
jgi:DNA-binding MarR family transcriptional regulator